MCGFVRSIFEAVFYCCFVCLLTFFSSIFFFFAESASLRFGVRCDTDPKHLADIFAAHKNFFVKLNSLDKVVSFRA